MSVDFDRLNASVNRVFGVGAKGTKARYTPQDGDAFDLDGVFDEAWQETGFPARSAGISLPVSTTRPSFGCRLSDFPEGVKPQQGDAITINCVDYEVSDANPDGVSGWFLLKLN